MCVDGLTKQLVTKQERNCYNFEVTPINTDVISYYRKLTNDMTQLSQLGKVLRSDGSSPLRTCALAPTRHVLPLVSAHIRRVGRPRREWMPTVLAEARARALGQIEEVAKDVAKWRALMKA